MTELRSPLGVIEGYVRQLIALHRHIGDRPAINAGQCFMANLLDMAKIERDLDYSPDADAGERSGRRQFSTKAKESGINLDQHRAGTAAD